MHSKHRFSPVCLTTRHARSSLATFINGGRTKGASEQVRIMLIEERGSPQDMHKARWLHSSMEAEWKELLNKCESCSLKSVAVTVAGHALQRGEPPTQPQLPPYNQPRRSSPNKPQVCRGGAQPRKKRIHQSSTTEGTKKKYHYPENRDNQALTVTQLSRQMCAFSGH